LTESSKKQKITDNNIEDPWRIIEKLRSTIKEKNTQLADQDLKIASQVSKIKKLKNQLKKNS
jgi:hypothetical protein